MRIKMRWWAFLLLAGILTACGSNSRKDEKAQVKYETKVMKPESRVYNLYIPASLHGVSEVEVYPRVSGIIREVNFKDGIKVTKGQTLGRCLARTASLHTRQAAGTIQECKAAGFPRIVCQRHV